MIVLLETFYSLFYLPPVKMENGNYMSYVFGAAHVILTSHHNVPPQQCQRPKTNMITPNRAESYLHAAYS